MALVIARKLNFCYERKITDINSNKVIERKVTFPEKFCVNHSSISNLTLFPANNISAKPLSNHLMLSAICMDVSTCCNPTNVEVLHLHNENF